MGVEKSGRQLDKYFRLLCCCLEPRDRVFSQVTILTRRAAPVATIPTIRFPVPVTTAMTSLFRTTRTTTTAFRSSIRRCIRSKSSLVALRQLTIRLHLATHTTSLWRTRRGHRNRRRPPPWRHCWAAPRWQPPLRRSSVRSLIADFTASFIDRASYVLFWFRFRFRPPTACHRWLLAVHFSRSGCGRQMRSAKLLVSLWLVETTNRTVSGPRWRGASARMWWPVAGDLLNANF